MNSRLSVTQRMDNQEQKQKAGKINPKRLYSEIAAMFEPKGWQLESRSSEPSFPFRLVLKRGDERKEFSIDQHQAVTKHVEETPFGFSSTFYVVDEVNPEGPVLRLLSNDTIVDKYFWNSQSDQMRFHASLR